MRAMKIIMCLLMIAASYMAIDCGYNFKKDLQSQKRFLQRGDKVALVGLGHFTQFKYDKCEEIVYIASVSTSVGNAVFILAKNCPNIKLDGGQESSAHIVMLNNVLRL